MATEQQIKEAKSKITRRQAKRRAHHAIGDEEITQMNKLLDAGLPLDNDTKELLKKSWVTLTDKKFVESSGLTKSGIGKLFEDFYGRFFEADPTGKRLFESSGLKAQGRALVSMIGMIIRCLDDFSSFRVQIQQLGGRHKIYGVKEKDFGVFCEILSQTIAHLLEGTDLDTDKVEKAWTAVISSLAQMMIAASLVANLPFTVQCNRRITALGTWKVTAVAIGLDAIHIYKSDELTKLRSSLPFKSITEIEIVTEQEGMSSPTGVSVTYGGESEKAIFSFNSREETEKWFAEVNWRVQATHRVYKYDEDEGSVSSDTSNTRNVKPSTKSRKGFSLASQKKKKLR
eukprot:TRINITY_DN5512_c0_g1_i5.p2 TRINITY_DN5512_c0_g1~~TRINITY_DN5512_c0_g1_i5.p2  ORF type:complete len:343 (+),score=84.50 TRINITY_DN5512_c0_g1_i5:1592-2620(+)